MTNGEIAAAADRFEGRPPVEVLAWAAERFARRVVFATGFGAEGCVLVDLIARHQLRHRRLHARHRPAVPRDLRALAAARGALRPRDPGGAPRQTRRGAGRSATATRSGSASPTAAARCARSSRSRRRSRAATPGSPPSAATRRPIARPARVVERDARFTASSRSTRSCPGRAADVWAYVREHDVPTNPLHERGLPEHRLPAVHEPRRRRRGPARRPLARPREDRVRAARPLRPEPSPCSLART